MNRTIRIVKYEDGTWNFGVITVKCENMNSEL